MKTLVGTEYPTSSDGVVIWSLLVFKKSGIICTIIFVGDISNNLLFAMIILFFFDLFFVKNLRNAIG